MNDRLQTLADSLEHRFGNALSNCVVARGEVTITLDAAHLLETCTALRDEDGFKFEMLVDLAGVDYQAYGVTEWNADEATAEGFSRGVQESTSGRFRFADAPVVGTHTGLRFAVVYHLLSITRNQRLRVKIFCEDDDLPLLDSVVGIWSSANWYEREAFDLFGIIFKGHPDLRRILTDYGFIGHPFRKDFPLVGHVEMRYDPEQGRVIYQPVTIEPRVLVPKTIRHDHRYIDDTVESEASDA